MKEIKKTNDLKAKEAKKKMVNRSLFGFFIKLHTNLQWLFNAKAILLEVQ